MATEGDAVGSLRLAWAPLRHSLFRALWIASFASNVGTMMQSVGAAWLMTSLAPSPTWIALVQTATQLPIFLLALLAGALADVVDRRRLLLVTQIWMLLVAGLLATLTWAGGTTPGLLLALTFALGLGAALNAPAWQAIVPELVQRPEIPAAVALNSAGFNLARAVGPAAGGLVVAWSGPAANFALNALSFVGVIFVLFRWRRSRSSSVLPAERVVGAMLAGLRYTRHAASLRAVLVRSASFVFFGSALWALLPSIARFELGLGARGYGVLLGFLGTGAVVGAILLPVLRNRFTLDGLLALAVLVFAGATLVPAAVKSFPLSSVAMLLGGVAWLTLLSSFNTSVQSSIPAWVRGRALAVYQLVTFGGLALGSALWGAVATWTSVPEALAAAAAGMVLGLALTARFRLGTGESVGLEPSRHWREPTVADGIDADAGPVIVHVEYRIDPDRWTEFARAVRALRVIRLRDGALRWHLMRDAADPSRCVESFMAESWVEHLRLHERVTVADREIEARVRAFHLGPEPPRVLHYVAQALPGSRRNDRKPH